MARKAKAAMTKLINLCDRVEVLDEIVCDAAHQLDQERFTALMEPFYPSLEQFFQDVKEEHDITSIATSIADQHVDFVATFKDTTEKTFSYDKYDEAYA